MLCYNYHVQVLQPVSIFVALQNGFQFHHAKPGYLMVYCWLQAAEVCNIPLFAHTMIGDGAVL